MDRPTQHPAAESDRVVKARCCGRTKGALLAIIAACIAAALQAIAPMPDPHELSPMWFETRPGGVALRFLGSLLPALPFCIVYGIATGAVLDDQVPGPIVKAFLVVVLALAFSSVFVILAPSLGCYLFATCLLHAIATAVWNAS